MIYIVISGHGRFADGLLSGAQLLSGESEACDAVSFAEGMTSDALRAELQRSVEKANGAPILFLTDILGGTPFRECSLLAGDLAQAEVVSGANLQLLVEALMERDDATDVREFAQSLIASAKECMVSLSQRLAKPAAGSSANEDDGI